MNKQTKIYIAGYKELERLERQITEVTKKESLKNLNIGKK